MSSLHDEPTDRLLPSEPTNPLLEGQATDRLSDPPSAFGGAASFDAPLSWSWRTAVAAGLAIAAVAVYVYALATSPDPPSGAHVNSVAGFSIEVPEGWTDRVDDRDGTFIRPEGEGADRRSSITVSVRLARDPDPRLALVDMQARSAGGPIRELKWIGDQRVMLDSGIPAVLAEFTQRYRGVPMHGWAMLAVHEARLFHAVGALPVERVARDHLELVDSLHSLSPLLPELPPDAAEDAAEEASSP